MTKRACPFEDSCTPLLKVHVGSDDIERRDTHHMKNIYDKTLHMLYQGVKNSHRAAYQPTTKQHIPQNVEDNADIPSHRLCVECNAIRFIQGNCWFCEVSLCDKCIKNCSLCSEKFCSRCSVAIYKNGNNYSCLTCYS